MEYQNNPLDAFKNLLKLLKEVEEEIQKNTDYRKKEVGDRVIVWDGSYSVDGSGRHYHGDELNNHECIVVSNTEKFEVPIQDDFKVTLDLIVFSTRFKTEIRTSSEMVKLVN